MNEIVELLNSAKHEIIALRRDNEIMRAKIEVMDLFACVLHTSAASRSQGASPDIAWAIEKKISEIRDDEERASALAKTAPTNQPAEDYLPPIGHAAAVEWKDVPGAPGYLVSADGQVRGPRGSLDPL